MGFRDKLHESARRNRSWLCVGLDPDLDRLPEPLRGARDPHKAVLAFNRAIVGATADLVCAFKPNSAFYEALGPRGIDVLMATCEAIPEGIPIVLDAKRGDVGHTARKYAEAVFDHVGADAVTLSPYLGRDAIGPFLDFDDRGVFLLCRTSNPSAGDLQDLICDGKPLYRHVAELALEWQAEVAASIGLVAGATYPDELRQVREVIGDEMPLLVPGVGVQSGDLASAVRAARSRRETNAIVNASRGVLYASHGEDFAEAARRTALAWRDGIRQGGSST